MLLLFFGGEMLVNLLLAAVGLGPVRFNTFFSGVLAIGFVFGAYYTETFRGAFLTVDRGQTEAAQAYGMRPWTVFRRVMLPQMLSFAIPGINNNWLGLMKASALVSIPAWRTWYGWPSRPGAPRRNRSSSISGFPDLYGHYRALQLVV